MVAAALLGALASLLAMAAIVLTLLWIVWPRSHPEGRLIVTRLTNWTVVALAVTLLVMLLWGRMPW